jgi:ATP-dependent Clp protease ATP-binding subunit ClpX
MKPSMTPSQIVKFLDQHVVGQEEAKRQLAVAVYTHYRKIELAAPERLEVIKSNVLLIGPTGTGKTLLCETLSRVLGVPFVTANATSLAQSEYVNDEIEAILERLIDKAAGDVAKAQRGIVFIDEMDKLKATERNRASCAAPRARACSTRCSRSWKVRRSSSRSGLHRHHRNPVHLRRRLCRHRGILSRPIQLRLHLDLGDDNQKLLDRLNARIKPTDLFEFGLIQEFAGRLPIVAPLKPLSRDMMVRIMTEPQNSIYAQYRQILGPRAWIW